MASLAWNRTAVAIVAVLVAGCGGEDVAIGAGDGSATGSSGTASDGGLSASESDEGPTADGEGSGDADDTGTTAVADDTGTDAGTGTDGSSGSTGSAARCGDDVAEGTEACDGTDLAGQTCTDQGFDGGTLACARDCTFDTAACVTYGGDCCAANGTPGCEDATCSASVCSDDPDCCSDTWDAACATFAAGDAACQDVGGSCPVCGDNAAEGTEVCDLLDLQGESCATQGFDVGFLACEADCSALDTDGCVDYVGDCCSAHGSPGCANDSCWAAICAATPSCCSATWTAACALAATTEPACQSVGGSCPDPTCGDDTAVGAEACDGTDLSGEDCASLGFSGGTLACEIDCTAFDTSGCTTFTGDCCADNGTPGCIDPACTASVCTGDPSCCADTWDAVCAAAAFPDPACIDAGGSCPTCGDDTAEGGEICDGGDLSGASCTDFGFAGGTLQCAADCGAYDLSICQDVGFGDCVNNPPATACLPDEQCVTDFAEPPTQGVCLEPSCTHVNQCPLAPPGGTASVQCIDVTGEGSNECVIFCGAPGLTCPTGMFCALGIACAWAANP